MTKYTFNEHEHMKPKYLLGLILILLFIATFGITLFFLTADDTVKQKTDETDVSQNVQEYDGFTLTTSYRGDKWEYSVQGYLPDPCYSYQVSEVIRESYPEQVTIEVTIVDPPAGRACVQVIQNLNHEDNFVASPDATIDLKVIR